MTRIILDSSAWIEYLADRPKADRVKPFLADARRILVPAVVFYEVQKKALTAFDEEVAETVAGCLSQSESVPLDRDQALTAAHLGLKHRLAMADALILAAARSCDAELITLDADFRGIPGVRVL